METMLLVGHEDVSRAGGAMRDAAASMQQAASSFDYALERHRNFMDDWLARFEAALERQKST